MHVYHASCWLLALVAFTQLLLVGIALAVRDRPAAAAEVVERVVTEYVQVPVASDSAGDPDPVALAVPPSVTPPPAETRPWNGESLGVPRPRIADPEVEALVEGAQIGRVEGDLARAAAKLFAAEKLAPADPNVLYELAQVHELAGNYGKAGDYYQKVLALGILGANGDLAKADELTGIMSIGELSLDGRVRSGPSRQSLRTFFVNLKAGHVRVHLRREVEEEA